MDAEAQRFLQRLDAGPSVLLLGQAHLAAETGQDPLLTQVEEKLGAADGGGYDVLLNLPADETADEFLAWMDERSRRVPRPTPLETVAEFAWSSVVTSAIDAVLPATFRRPWRELQPILDEHHDPADPRNRTRLHITFLYGNVNRLEPSQRVPLSRLAFLKRSQVATMLARRIPNLVTPLGTLAIDGYRASDWLSIDQLVPILADLGPGQAHLFSANTDLLEHPVFTELLSTGLLQLHEDSLANVLRAGAAAGLVQLGPGGAGRGEHPLRLKDKTAHIPTELWTRVRASATVLDDQVFVTPRSLSPDARYREFRAFLGAGDGVPNWSAFGQGFAYTRAFQGEARTIVEKALSTPGVQDQPIVVHGPTGSGKTTGVAALACEIRLGGEYPVLFLDRSVETPSFGDIDVFCEWAETEGAPATLVVWDGMLSVAYYRELLRYLSSRGRNAVVLGTSYRLPEDHARGRWYIEAPAELNADERQGFLTFLRGFDLGLDELVQRQRVINDESFLVALYRLLPPVRGVVRTGVAREVSHAEEAIALAAETVNVEYSAPNALARALYEAGLIGDDRLSKEARAVVGSERVDDFQHLTGLIMVPGRFGLSVPLELVLRTLGQEGFANFLALLRGVDIFRWYEDANGNIDIGPRTRLEATLIAEARTGDPATEVAFIQELILNAKHDTSSISGGREVAFIVRLVQAVGPGGEQAHRFADHISVLADTLQDARLVHGLLNARLMLQEANLRREFAIDEAKRHAPDESAIGSSLDEAETVVREGLELLTDQQRSHGLRSALLVELASTMGARSTQLVRGNGQGRIEAAGLVVALRDVVARARLEDPTTYHPVDVLAWATRNAIENGLLSGSGRVEAISDVLSAFQGIEVHELEPRQAEQYHKRRYEIGGLIGDEDLEADAYNELKVRGSGAGLFLRALQTSGILGRQDGEELGRADAERAVQLLEAEQDLLWTDRRCLDLYLDLWWLAKTGVSLFSGERRTPGLLESEWQHFLRIATALEHQSGGRREAVLGFLRGLALFHLGRVSESLAVFKVVERESVEVRSRRRVIRTFLASNATGQAREFHGTVSWLDPRGRRGELYVEELRATIVFLPHDFRLEEVRRGLALGTFHIAFNFLGPVADPPIVAGAR